jgi:large subunit ribosomal protein L24
VTSEAAIHISNVMVVDGKGTTRLGSKRVEATKRRTDGSTYETTRSVRISRKSGDEI